MSAVPNQAIDPVRGDAASSCELEIRATEHPSYHLHEFFRALAGRHSGLERWKWSDPAHQFGHFKMQVAVSAARDALSTSDSREPLHILLCRAGPPAFAVIRPHLVRKTLVCPRALRVALTWPVSHREVRKQCIPSSTGDFE